MQSNIRSYDKLEFQRSFSTTDVYKSVEKDFPFLVWDKNLSDYLIDKRLPIKFTENKRPRQLIAEQGIVTLCSFYYLNFLLETNPTNIYDLGCGSNFFKQYIPNIIGLDQSPEADIKGTVDSSYIRDHQNYFESVFSINALHYHPVENLNKVVNNFISIVRPGGRGYLAINIARMIERSKLMYLADYKEKLDAVIRTMISNLDCEILVFDLDLNHMTDGIDGNLRIVFERGN